jgi:hypothetical protein
MYSAWAQLYPVFGTITASVDAGRHESGSFFTSTVNYSNHMWKTANCGKTYQSYLHRLLKENAYGTFYVDIAVRMYETFETQKDLRKWNPN